jgi:hypothetical protein
VRIILSVFTLNMSIQLIHDSVHAFEPHLK